MKNCSVKLKIIDGEKNEVAYAAEKSTIRSGELIENNILDAMKQKNYNICSQLTKIIPYSVPTMRC